MRRAPEKRQQSVLELVRELQSVEADLGLAQTPLEASVDDWVAATPGDAEDQTRITGPGTLAGAGTRRRRSGGSARAESLTRERSTQTRGGQTRGTQTRGQRDTSYSRRRRTRRWTGLAWAGGLILLAGTAAMVLTLVAGGNTAGIPQVSDVTGTPRAGSIVFAWENPGVQSSDNYVVQLRSGEKSIQRGTEFGVDPEGRGTVCVTVTVNRAGVSGEPSAEKCVDATVTQ